MKDVIDRLTDGLDETQRQALGDLSALAYLLESDVMPTRSGRRCAPVGGVKSLSARS